MPLLICSWSRRTSGSIRVIMQSSGLPASWAPHRLPTSSNYNVSRFESLIILYITMRQAHCSGSSMVLPTTFSATMVRSTTRHQPHTHPPSRHMHPRARLHPHAYTTTSLMCKVLRCQQESQPQANVSRQLQYHPSPQARMHVHSRARTMLEHSHKLIH